MTTSLQIYPQLKFYQSLPTLNRIKNIINKHEKGVYLRFGDGDVNLAHGLNDSYCQQTQNLQKEMQEALSLNGHNILKALPLHCKEFDGFETGMFPGNHEAPFNWCLNLLSKTEMYWGEFQDVYSAVALHHLASSHQDQCIDFLRFLKHSNCQLLIGNQDIPESLRHLLFGQNCQFIPTPSRDSYQKIDQIEKKCLELIDKKQDYQIIITSMGCSGRVLQKRLWGKLNNIFLFDFGSLIDALCGWTTRAWITLTHFNKNDFLKKLSEPSIKVVCTSALIPYQFESRKNDYIKAFEHIRLKSFPEPFIVEAIKPTGKTFLEEYSNHVFYSPNNNSNLYNKGVNEARHLLNGLRYFKFEDNQMIIKLTGRSHVKSNLLISLIKNNPYYDAFVKLDPHGQVYTFYFAMRNHYLIKFLETIDYEAMEAQMINIEKLLANYLTNHQEIKTIYVDKLDITANIFGKGNITILDV